MEAKNQKPKAHVSEHKKKRVVELSNLIKENNCILVASIKGLPSSQFQEIVKTLRGKAVVKVPKKSLINRAIEGFKDEKIDQIKNQIGENVAILFSGLDPFELSAELIQNKKPARAKPGQVTPVDIEIPEGPTDLVPGPAITELGSLGIQIQIEKGKIHIKQAKVIAKEGEKLSRPVAELTNKFNLSPFTIGFVPLVAYDIENKKLYTDIKIDTEETVEDLKYAFGKALPFAVEIGYTNDETIKFLLGKAASHEKAIETLTGKETTEESEEKIEKSKTETSDENANAKETAEESKEEEKKDDENKEETLVEEDPAKKSEEAGDNKEESEDKTQQNIQEEKNNEN